MPEDEDPDDLAADDPLAAATLLGDGVFLATADLAATGPGLEPHAESPSRPNSSIASVAHRDRLILRITAITRGGIGRLLAMTLDCICWSLGLKRPLAGWPLPNQAIERLSQG